MARGPAPSSPSATFAPPQARRRGRRMRRRPTCSAACVLPPPRRSRDEQHGRRRLARRLAAHRRAATEASRPLHDQRTRAAPALDAWADGLHRRRGTGVRLIGVMAGDGMGKGGPPQGRLWRAPLPRRGGGGLPRRRGRRPGWRRRVTHIYINGPARACMHSHLSTVLFPPTIVEGRRALRGRRPDL